MSQPPSDEATPQRIGELADGLAATRERIERACRNAGRDPAQVHLIVVTKTWPARDVRALAELGVRDVGENKAGELADKRDTCADVPLTWHFIGQIQSNKARLIGAHADVVHAVDRAKVLTPLARGAADIEGDRRAEDLGCLVQVSLDPDPMPERGGIAADQAGWLADQIALTPGLVLRGVMGVAPLAGDPRQAFERLRRTAEAIRREHPQADWISAGMSGDLEAAVEAGATHLRVGSAILGSRPSLG